MYAFARANSNEVLQKSITETLGSDFFPTRVDDILSRHQKIGPGPKKIESWELRCALQTLQAIKQKELAEEVKRLINELYPEESDYLGPSSSESPSDPICNTTEAGAHEALAIKRSETAPARFSSNDTAPPSRQESASLPLLYPVSAPPPAIDNDAAGCVCATQEDLF